MSFTITRRPRQLKIPTHRGSARLTLNCTQVLRSASKFAPGHRVERSAFGTVLGPKQLKKTFECKGGPSCFFTDKLTDADRLIRLAAGACLDSHWRLRSSSRFFPRSEQRAERGMDVDRRRPPRACDPDPALRAQHTLVTHLSLKYVKKALNLFRSRISLTAIQLPWFPMLGSAGVQAYFLLWALKIKLQLKKVRLL